MGFDTVIATVIATVIIIFVAYTFISGSTSIAESAINGYKESVKTELKRLNTAIEILNVTYNNGELQAYFKNTGNERFKGFSEFDAFIYGKTTNGTEVIKYFESANYTIVNELINPGIFDPCETAEVTVSVTLDNGTYVFLLCTPNAVCDSYGFTVG